MTTKLRFSCAIICSLMVQPWSYAATDAAAQTLSSLPEPLIQVLSLNNGESLDGESPSSLKIRSKAVIDQAFILGSQTGLFWHGQRLVSLISGMERHLDSVWDFSDLMLSNHRIMPPVIGDIRGSQEIKADTRVMISRDLMILRKARFVQYPPTWRSYLLANDFMMPNLADVNPILYPLPEEYDLWERHVLRGWEAGVKQANMIMHDSIQRLSRDFNGMIRYHILLDMNMITPPFVAEDRTNVSGNDDHMSIDKRIQTITVKPRLNRNHKMWFAVPAIKDAFNE